MPTNDRAPTYLIVIMTILIVIAVLLVCVIVFPPQTISKMFGIKTKLLTNNIITPTPIFTQQVVIFSNPTPTPVKTQEEIVIEPIVVVSKIPKPKKNQKITKKIDNKENKEEIKRISQALSIPITDILDKPLQIIVNKETHDMEIFADKKSVASYKVTIGKEDEKNKTNPGIYFLGEIVYNSPWYPPQRIVKELEESGEDSPLLQEIKANGCVRSYDYFAKLDKFTKSEGNLNPIGPIWIDIFWQSNWSEDDPGVAESGLGIHGTNEPDKIGGSWGHGCIRMKNENIAELVSKINSIGGVANTVLIIKSK